MSGEIPIVFGQRAEAAGDAELVADPFVHEVRKALGDAQMAIRRMILRLFDERTPTCIDGTKQDLQGETFNRESKCRQSEVWRQRRPDDAISPAHCSSHHFRTVRHQLGGQCLVVALISLSSGTCARQPEIGLSHYSPDGPWNDAWKAGPRSQVLQRNPYGVRISMRRCIERPAIDVQFGRLRCEEEQGLVDVVVLCTIKHAKPIREYWRRHDGRQSRLQRLHLFAERQVGIGQGVPDKGCPREEVVRRDPTVLSQQRAFVRQRLFPNRTGEFIDQVYRQRASKHLIAAAAVVPPRAILPKSHRAILGGR